MRKTTLIASMIFFAAAAGAAPTVVVAANDAPATAQPSEQPKAYDSQNAMQKKQPAKKPRRETDEQKARRIGAKYGVYW